MSSYMEHVGGIAELERVFKLQKDSARNNLNPTLEERLDWLDRLEKMIRASRVHFSEALTADFGSHPPLVSDLYETGGVIGRAKYFKRNLGDWLQPRTIDVSKKLHGSDASAAVVLMPKGVVGNIAPWNFPIECALVMAADMLAAGNRIILKPSLMAPRVADAISVAIADHFPEDVMSTAMGGEQLTEQFPHLPWDHLTYTGNARVARIVLSAAAENLVPVTLELGGKNPTVFTEDAIDDELIRTLLEAKIMKGGQVCIAPDHVFVPRRKCDEWLSRAKKLWSEMYPTYVGHPDATSTINTRHYDRVLGFVEEARSHKVEVCSLNGDKPDAVTRQIPMYVIVEPPASLACMSEEIFGPVIPLCSYDDFDEVIALINSAPSPLASYIATHDEKLAGRFVQQVKSGGVGINNFGTQAGYPAIPFGGIGQSGFGCHSGYEGFLNYSHAKGVFRGSADSLVVQSMRLPYGQSAAGFVDAIFK